MQTKIFVLLTITVLFTKLSFFPNILPMNSIFTALATFTTLKEYNL